MDHNHGRGVGFGNRYFIKCKIHAGGKDGLAGIGAQHDPFIYGVFFVKYFRQGVSGVFRSNVSKKAQAAEVDAQYGGFIVGYHSQCFQECPVTAQADGHIYIAQFFFLPEYLPPVKADIAFCKEVSKCSGDLVKYTL
ncbi:hypothetical protein D9M69_650540 [compost metagenome]